jgi:hypothetical protein
MISDQSNTLLALQSRRRLIKAAAISASAGLPAAFGQQPPLQSQQRPPLQASKAVFDGFSATSYELYTRLLSSSAGSNEFKAFATSFSILTQHMEEIGFMGYLSRRAEETSTYKKPLDPDFADRVITVAARSGIKFDKTFARNSMIQAQKEWPSIEKLYAESGILGLNQFSTASLHQYADEIGRTGGLRASMLGPDSLPVRPVGSSFCAGVAVASVYVATWGVMDALAIIAVPGAGVGVAVAGLALAAAGMYCA